jgi:single-stranded DNA-binding protein
MNDGIYLAGTLSGNPKLSETAKGKLMCRLLLSARIVREIKRGQFEDEEHLLPIVCFAWVAEQAKELVDGARVVVACHLSGSRFEAPSGEVRHGVQLIADGLYFPSAHRPVQPAKELLA